MNHRQEMNRPWFPHCLTVLLMMPLLAAGCGVPRPHAGKPRADVVVTITYGGTPVTEGLVDLRNEETGEGGGGELNRQGIAVIPGVVLGSYTVTVVPRPPIVVPGDEARATPPAEDAPNIPEKFRIAATSPLRATVEEGSNQLTFDLRDDSDS